MTSSSDNQFKIRKKLKLARKIRQEDDEGNIEYKWKLCSFNNNKRREKLISQMNYRLNQGDGIAIYNIGYHDNGDPIGIEYDRMLNNLDIIHKLAELVSAEIKSMKIFRSNMCFKPTYCANVYIMRDNKDRDSFITIDDLLF